jgi:hypothetical protein
MAEIESMVRIDNHPLFTAMSGITAPELEVTFRMDERALIVYPDTMVVNGQTLTDKRAVAALFMRVQMEVESAILAVMDAKLAEPFPN